MPQKCSKCGVETDYNGDLHCRNIFVEEINKLLSLHELEKAKALYLSTLFDKAWKENFLYSRSSELKMVILEEEQRAEDKKQKELLSELKKVRTPCCYDCKMPLNSLSDTKCDKCGWIKCSCGACGCGYDGQDFNNADIL